VGEKLKAKRPLTRRRTSGTLSPLERVYELLGGRFMARLKPCPPDVDVRALSQEASVLLRCETRGRTDPSPTKVKNRRPQGPALRGHALMVRQALQGLAVGLGGL
jgi:hypothetical protein